VRKELLTRDPDNILIARQSRMRLPAELIRDGALYAGGILNLAIGGRSVRPPLPAGIAELGYANSVKWVEDKGPERYRRGLYVHFQRTTPYPQMVNFDAPESTVSCTRRSRSNTPLQALNLLNDTVFIEAAQGLALRVLRESHGDVNDRIDYAFQCALGRKPTAKEAARLARYYEQQLNVFKSDEVAAAALMPVPVEGVEKLHAATWAALSRVVLNLDEFITRE
jgi:hypothetical protein